MLKSHRKIAREKATIGIYQHLLVGSNYEDIKLFLDSYNELNNNENSMEFAIWIVSTVLANKDSYIDLVNKYIKKGWSFTRLGHMEQAILLVAICEMLESDLPKKIIINEAVNHAKVFCNDDSYKLVNGILSRLV